MARSPSPGPTSKRRRHDERSPRPDDDRSPKRDSRRRESGRESTRDRDYAREDRERDRERDRDRDSRRREPESEREKDRSRGHTSSRRYDDDSHRSSSRRDERSRSRDRDRDRERERERERDRDRDSRPRHRSRSRERNLRDDHRSSRTRDNESPRHRSDNGRSRSPEKRDYDRSPLPAAVASPLRSAKSAFVSTFSAPPPGPVVSAPGSPLVDTKAREEEEKLRVKREKLEAWKAKKAKEAAEKAVAAAPPVVPAPKSVAAPGPLKASLPSKPISTSTPKVSGLPSKPATSQPIVQPAVHLSASDPAARALAAAAAISNRLAPASTSSTLAPPSSSLPAKPSFSFTSSSTTTSAFRPSGLKTSLMALGEDVEERGIQMVKIEGEVDMTVEAGDDGDDDEDLEGGVVYAAREGGREGRVDVEMTDVKTEESEAEIKPNAMEVEEEEEEDELEAFMNNVQKQVKNVDKDDKAKLMAAKGRKPLVDAEGAEEEEEETPDSGDEMEKVGMSAAEILAIAAKKVKRGRELHGVDHSKINYEPFRKAFYHAPPEVEELTPEQVEEMRIEMDGIKVRGADPPKPVSKWSYCGLPAPCIEVIRGLEYAAPTSIQAQAIPAIMSGRDIIGVAKTGSGKTIAFLLPMFRHIKDQRPIKTLEGPIAMIMTPTRELATQIHRECKPFLKALGLRASVAYGGTPLKDNIADMKRGSELVVCTPGRMIELLTTNSGRIINMQRITYLVLDEADRMFDMGFEPQVMKIINQIRPDRQTVLFSATFPRQMEALARKILRRPLEITVGGRSIVAPEIDQIVEVRAEETKFNRLLELLGRLSNDDADARALIFVERQDSADKLLQELLKKNYACMSLHGGMEQVDRDQAIADFKSGIIPVVIATSVAARGLDVKQLKLVVQYDAPNHMEDYVHRAGRTGRAGNKGTCVTFVTPDQDRYALDIFKALTASSANVPDELKAMAEAFAEKVKEGKASAASGGFGGKGLESLADGRDAQTRAQHAMFSEETGGADKKPTPSAVEEAADSASKVADMEIEIKRGPAPDTSKRGSGAISTADKTVDAASLAAMKAAEAAAIAAGKPAGVAKAQSVIANFNAMLKAKAAGRASENDLSTDSARRRDPDATDFHAIIYINDYPQKARWKVTNKETMVQLVESTGASITNKGVFYEPGKEPGPDELPKLHLLIESNEEFRVKHAISEIKRSLIEGATMALEAEQRNPGTAPGRYTV